MDPTISISFTEGTLSRADSYYGNRFGDMLDLHLGQSVGPQSAEL